MNQPLLMAHVLFGVVCILAAVWVFVEALQSPLINTQRIRRASWIAAGAMWCSILCGGYWYIVYYKTDKSIILKGPWPGAHNFFMESKEHLVIALWLLATYLPIVAGNDLTGNKSARRLLLCVSGLVASLALLMEAYGGIIAMGAKVSLLSK